MRGIFRAGFGLRGEIWKVGKTKLRKCRARSGGNAENALTSKVCPYGSKYQQVRAPIWLPQQRRNSAGNAREPNAARGRDACRRSEHAPPQLRSQHLTVSGNTLFFSATP